MHIDIDAAEISKNRYPQLVKVGDVRKVLLEILKELETISIRSWNV
jgi:thiamine pyrophosphate-dependent acetolactate synthase large subunit-like protein